MVTGVLYSFMLFAATYVNHVNAASDDDFGDDDDEDLIAVTDCTTFCRLPMEPTKIRRELLLGRVKLPRLFRMTFEYNIQYFNELEEFNFFEIQCGSRKVFTFNIHWPDQIMPYYGGDLVGDIDRPDKTEQISIQPASLSMRSKPPMERYWNQYSITFQEDTLHMEGFTPQQNAYLYLPRYPSFGTCDIWGSSPPRTDFADPLTSAMIRNIQIVSSTLKPTIQPTIAPTKHQGTFKPTSIPSTAQPTNSHMCCSNFDYRDKWATCNNGADPDLVNVEAVHKYETDPCEYCIGYQCLDWTIGSQGNFERQFNFMEETQEDVYFAVGTVGSDRSLAGLCYRVDVEGMKKDIIMQVVTNTDYQETGEHVWIQQANGGLGFGGNACSGLASLYPQYLASDEPWGDYAWGWTEKKMCKNLPSYPACGRYPEDNLQDMCEWTFDQGVRQDPEPGNNYYGAPITSICQVSCPYQLWQSTGFHRSDEPVAGEFTCTAQNTVFEFDEEAEYEEDTRPRLKGQMDCGKPDYADLENIPAEAEFFAGHEQVIACKRDGYARINQAPTMHPTGIPTHFPTSHPTSIPTSHPTAFPTTVYAPSSVPTIFNISDPRYANMTLFPPKKGTPQKPRAPLRAVSNSFAQSSESVGGPNTLALMIFAVIFVVFGLVMWRYEKHRSAKVEAEKDYRRGLRLERQGLLRNATLSV